MLTSLALALAICASAPHIPATVPGPPPVNPAVEIAWFQGPHMSALGKARKERKPIALYFWMDGSAQCSRLYAETLQEAPVAQVLDDTICVGIDIASTQGTRLVQRYGVTVLPTLLFLTPDGEAEDVVIGFIPAGGLVAEIQRIQAGTNTVSDFRRRLDESPEDLALRHQLATKLRDVGDGAGHDALVAEIRALDPEGATPTGARLLFWEVRQQALGGAAPAEVDLAPVYAHLERITPREIRFEAWDWVAQFELERERGKEGRVAARRAWEFAGDSNRLPFGARTARGFFQMRGELDEGDKAFLLEIGRKAGELVRALDGDVSGLQGLEWEEGEGYDSGLAFVLEAQSMAEFVNGNLKEAIALIEECLALAPENPELPGRLALYKGKGADE